MQLGTCADLAAVKSRAARVCRSRVIKYDRIELREQVRCEHAQVNTRESPSETENPSKLLRPPAFLAKRGGFSECRADPVSSRRQFERQLSFEGHRPLFEGH